MRKVLPCFAGLEVVVASLMPPRASKKSRGTKETPTARQADIIISMLPHRECMASRGSSFLKGERLKGGNDVHVHTSRFTPFPIGKEDVSRAALGSRDE